ncbi:MAG: zinc-dependent metalloprotease [Bacteroidota bacterium]
MGRKLTLLLFILAALHLSIAPGFSQRKRSQANQSAKPVDTRKKYEGYFNFYYDGKQDKIFLEIDKLDTEFLYVNSLSAGVGSNDIGLDRGQLGNTRVVKFERRGPKVLLVQPNYQYRAISDNADERRAVKEAFAESVLFGFTITSESGGSVTVDATNFFMQDAHGVASTLRRTNQGNYKLDKSRSAFYLPQTKNFPENTEFDVTLTFTGTPAGRYIRSVTPTPANVTVRQHHSFIKLPDDEYTPRVFDPRAGYFSISYMDYATPISEPIMKRFISRHRLKKKDPSAAVSEAVEPIIYYLDRGAPEPIRSALIDGARWWNQAFEAAGYKNAFQVELLPEGADPMDVRYNVIQWVHRSTRGWSYGASVRDPRTGEIIKGHVSLGSLRVRQDFLIAEGLLAPYENGTEVPKEMAEMALARLRQLSAHEVGHTLGLAHSYASSTEGRASVMDYPHPLVKITNGKIDLSDAYDDKIGAWDKVAIAFGYQDFAEGVDEAEGLENIIQKSLKEGLTFLSDQDARPQSGAHPHAHLWDNGKNITEELDHVMKVRALALRQFGEKNIRKGMPMATLEEVLAPIYFFHRYQTEAAVKVVGGLNYRYAMRGDGQLITEMVPEDEQMKALNSVLSTVTPNALALPESVLQMIPPRPLGYGRTREVIGIRTGLTFDALGAAESAADFSMGLLLNPAKANRLVEYNARNSAQPSLEGVINKVLNSTIKLKNESGYHGEIQRTVNVVVVEHLINLASSRGSSSQTKAIATYALDQLRDWMNSKINTSNQRAHFFYLDRKIEQFLDDPEEYEAQQALTPPAGSPIGTDHLCGGHFDF